MIGLSDGGGPIAGGHLHTALLNAAADAGGEVNRLQTAIASSLAKGLDDRVQLDAAWSLLLRAVDDWMALCALLASWVERQASWQRPGVWSLPNKKGES